MRSGNHHQRTGNVVINSEFKIPNSEFETARLKEPWKGGVMNLDATIPTHRGNQVEVSVLCCAVCLDDSQFRLSGRLMGLRDLNHRSN